MSRARAFRQAGRRFFYVGAGISVAEGLSGTKPAHQVASDIVMAMAGVAGGPPGAMASAVYCVSTSAVSLGFVSSEAAAMGGPKEAATSEGVGLWRCYLQMFDSIRRFGAQVGDHGDDAWLSGVAVLSILAFVNLASLAMICERVVPGFVIPKLSRTAGAIGILLVGAVHWWTLRRYRSTEVVEAGRPRSWSWSLVTRLYLVGTVALFVVLLSARS